MRVITFIKRLFCKHEYEVCRKNEPFACISGEQLYKRCKKCGKVKEWIWYRFE